MKILIKTSLIMFLSSMFISGCSVDDAIHTHEEFQSSVEKAAKMAINSHSGYKGVEPCPVGVSDCAVESGITTDWVVLDNAIEYVDNEDQSQVIAGIQIIDKKTIRYNLLYQGSEYGYSGQEFDGNLHIGEGGKVLPEASARRLGVSSITLQEGIYRIQNNGDQVWSGYAEVKAIIE